MNGNNWTMVDAKVEEFVLEILSGLHRGVRQQVSAGSYSIGRSTECDIVLSDGSVKEQHAEITLSADSVKVSPLDGVVFIDGTQINGATERSEYPFQFQIGNVLLSLDSTVDSVGTGPDGGWIGELGAKINAHRQAKESREDHEPSALGRLGVWLVGLVLVGLLVVPLVYLLGGALGDARDIRDERAMIREVLEYYGLNTALVEPSALGDSWIISGYKQDFATHKTDIEDRLDSESIDYELRITDSDAVLQSSRNVLNGLNVNLDVEAGVPGEVVLIGFVEDQEQLQRVVRAIAEDVSGVKEVNTDQIAIGTLAMDHVAVLLQDNDLAEDLSVTRERDVITVHGALPANRTGAWDAVRNQFEFRYAPHMILTLGSRPKNDRPVFLVRGVWTGKNPYVLMDDGQKYHEGTVLDGGWKIERISTNQVLLQRGEEALALSY